MRASEKRRLPQDRGRACAAHAGVGPPAWRGCTVLWASVFDEHRSGKIGSLLVLVQQREPIGRLQRAETQTPGTVAAREKVYEIRAQPALAVDQQDRPRRRHCTHQETGPPPVIALPRQGIRAMP